MNRPEPAVRELQFDSDDEKKAKAYVHPSHDFAPGAPAHRLDGRSTLHRLATTCSAAELADIPAQPEVADPHDKTREHGCTVPRGAREWAARSQPSEARTWTLREAQRKRGRREW